jgi:GAF domain-containing protein
VNAREGLIADAFVELADTLVDDFDVVDFLQTLVEHAVALLHVDAGGIILFDQRRRLQVMASSSEAAQVLELFELQAEQGPCVDCARTGEPVLLTEPAAMHAAWPRFTPHLLDAGFGMAGAIPMRLRTEVVGALNVFRVAPGQLAPGDLKLGRALADVATVGIVQQRTISARDLVAEQLRGALDSRVLIEQAKGMLAERAGLEVGAAFELLRRRARETSTPLLDVARALLAGETDR